MDKIKSAPIELREALFWDTDPATIDLEKNARYVIERILDFGTDEEVRWMWYYYDHDLIRDVVATSRVLFPSTKTLWHLMFTTQVTQ